MQINLMKIVIFSGYRKKIPNQEYLTKRLIFGFISTFHSWKDFIYNLRESRTINQSSEPLPIYYLLSSLVWLNSKVAPGVKDDEN